MLSEWNRFGAVIIFVPGLLHRTISAAKFKPFIEVDDKLPIHREEEKNAKQNRKHKQIQKENQ